jgi:phosphatidylethanolamine/phosphatidyl-N-methylethanolamine N-methyltransferase
MVPDSEVSLNGTIPDSPSAMLTFITEFLKHPSSVGAVAPSSRFLARTILAAADLKNCHVIVEFGPGTGAFTKYLCQQLRPDQRYIGIELNTTFARLLRQEFPTFTFVHDSVENLQAISAEHQLGSIDAIICGLPCASLPLRVQDNAFRAMSQLMHDHSVFCTFAYLQGLVLPGAQALRARLRKEFRSVTYSRIVWCNFPPAFVYICRR